MSEQTVSLKVEETGQEVAKAKPATAKRTTKAKAKAEEPPRAKFGYLKNKEGRVFEATPELLKQKKKGKFGLIKIAQSEYLEALKNGGMAEPEPDFEDEDED